MSGVFDIHSYIKNAGFRRVRETEESNNAGERNGKVGSLYCMTTAASEKRGVRSAHWVWLISANCARTRYALRRLVLQASQYN